MSVILLYHRVADVKLDPFGLAVSPEVFARHVTTLSRDYQPISLESFVDAAIAGTLAADAVALTFDDGYLDNLTVAAPILERAGVPATFFVTTAPLETGSPYWWDQLVHTVYSASKMPPTVAVPSAEGERGLPVDPDPDRRLWDFHGALRSLSPLERSRAMTEIAAQLGAASEAGLPEVMRASGVRQLARYRALSIGAHGVSHRLLPELPVDEQESELRECRSALEALLNREVSCVAYPFGAASAETALAARRAGFESGFIVGGHDVSARFDRLRIPRLEVRPGTRDIDTFIRNDGVAPE